MKGKEIIYSQQASDFIKGRTYSNPRFFSTPRSDATKVYLVGDWPAIRAAYEALDVPVEQIDAAAVTTNGPPDVVEGPAAPDDPGSVVIPGDWKTLGWQDLRKLAAQVSSLAVKNKGEATDAIQAELDRRKFDVALDDADGLTLRELHADLEALDVQFDPDAAPADLLFERNRARAAREGGSAHEALFGSSLLPSVVPVGDLNVQLGAIVGISFGESGLPLADWNALPEDEREGKLKATVDRLTADPEAAKAEIPAMHIVPAE